MVGSGCLGIQALGWPTSVTALAPMLVLSAWPRMQCGTGVTVAVAMLVLSAWPQIQLGFE